MPSHSYYNRGAYGQQYQHCASTQHKIMDVPIVSSFGLIIVGLGPNLIMSAIMLPTTKRHTPKNRFWRRFAIPLAGPILAFSKYYEQ